MLQAAHPLPVAPETPSPGGGPTVRHLRQVLLWPLRLMPLPVAPGEPPRPSWQVLAELAGSPWHQVVDEYTGDSEAFHERHYNEFVTFLPYVQRFLYGEGRGHHGAAASGGAPMRVFRRHDIERVRVVVRAG